MIDCPPLDAVMESVPLVPDPVKLAVRVVGGPGRAPASYPWMRAAI